MDSFLDSFVIFGVAAGPSEARATRGASRGSGLQVQGRKGPLRVAVVCWDPLRFQNYCATQGHDYLLAGQREVEFHRVTRSDQVRGIQWDDAVFLDQEAQVSEVRDDLTHIFTISKLRS